MAYEGDLVLSQILDCKFVSTAAATGAPTTLTAGAISVYKDNSTTQSTAGVTFTGDFDSVTGLNNVRIDTSADGTFYSAGSNFQVVITTGTVGGTSAVGYVVASFSILNRSPLRPATAGQTLAVDGSGRVDVSKLAGQTVTAAAGVTFPTSVASPTNITAGTITTTTSVTNPVSITAGQLFVKKNTQITITFPMTDSTNHLPATGLAVTARRTIDGAAVGACANAATELSLGLYSIVLAAADVNGTQITLMFSAAAADTRWIGLVTQA